MKFKFKKVSVLGLLVTAASLTACGGGGDDSPIGPENYGEVTVSTTQMSDSTVALKVTNNSSYATGHINFGLPSDTSGFAVYDAESSTSWCTTTTCPDSCDQMEVLQPGQSCYGYVNAEDAVGYLDGSKTSINAISITNVSQSLNYDLTNTGVLYGMGSDGRIYYKTQSETSWSSINKPTNLSSMTTIAVDNAGMLYAGGSNGHVYKYDSLNSKWSDLGAVGVSSVNAIAFNSANTLYAAGSGSPSIFKYSDGSWSIADTPNNSLTDITNIGFNSDGNGVITGKENGTTKFYKLSNNVWTALSLPSGLSSYIVSGFGYDPNSGEFLTSFSGNNNTYQYFKSFDTWTWDTSLNPVATNTANDFFIESKPTGETEYLATTGSTGQIYQYSGSSGSWQEITQTGVAITKLAEGSKITIAQNNA